MSESTSPKKETIGVFSLVFGLVLLLVVIGVPAIGVWTASSLAAYRNGPVWLVCLLGLLLFPVLPIVWDAWAESRRKPAASSTRLLSWWDRVVLRTLVLNVLFLAVLLLRFPSLAFTALSTRGDWFLEGRTGPRVETVRSLLFGAAGRLEWLYAKVRKERTREDLPQTATVTPATEPEAARIPTAEVAVATPERGETRAEAPPEPDGAPVWPMTASLHPLVREIPASVETDHASVARYLAGKEPNPWQRIKALHDYVADRVAYDVDSYRAGRRTPQDAESVFRERKAVCAGYARLLAAMGEVAGEDIRVVSGDARLRGSDLTGESHAWNVARVGNEWTLLDATWDSGYLDADSGAYVKEYETSYLYTPPEVFAVTHFPDEAAWQLRKPELSRGDFFRQPMMRALFFAEGLRLVSPDRSQVTVDEEVGLRIGNPRGRYLLGKLVRDSGAPEIDCKVSRGEESAVDCRLPEPGSYRLRLFSSPEEYGDRYRLVGEVVVLGRPR